MVLANLLSPLWCAFIYTPQCHQSTSIRECQGIPNLCSPHQLTHFPCICCICYLTIGNNECFSWMLTESWFTNDRYMYLCHSVTSSCTGFDKWLSCMRHGYSSAGALIWVTIWVPLLCEISLDGRKMSIERDAVLLGHRHYFLHLWCYTNGYFNKSITAFWLKGSSFLIGLRLFISNTLPNITHISPRTWGNHMKTLIVIWLH